MDYYNKIYFGLPYSIERWQNQINLLKFPSRIDYLKRVENLISNLSSHYKINQAAKEKISLAVLEAVNNAILHGNKLDFRKNGYNLFSGK